jgi:hypothetical protein
MNAEPADFTEFWPQYLAAHMNPSTRQVHYAGTVLAVFIILATCYGHGWWAFLAVPIVGYGPAWASHLWIERNRPATFRHPVWSLLGDFKMLFMAATGKLEDELWRYKLV